MLPVVLRSFTWGHATRFSKRSFSSTSQNRHLLRMGGQMYAHPDKFEKGRMGEDAFFLCEPGMGKLHNHAHQAFGVADGVGDWVFLRDVDSALYSQQLVKLCQQGFRDDPGSGPMKTLRQSYHQLKELETRGSSTICLANFDCWTGVLSIANLGDSGLFVIRNGRVVFKTVPQNHIFGVPFQLSSDYHYDTGSQGSGYELAEQSGFAETSDHFASMTVAQLKDELRNRGLKVSGRKHELVHRISKHDDATATNNDRSHCTGSETRGKFYNLPHDADESSVSVQDGDLIIAATDGFFDNVDCDEAAGDIWRMRAMDTSSLAKTMARYAFEVSRGAVRGVVETPFSKQAQEEMNMVYSGGKLDDITVVVGKVYPGS